MRNDHYILKGKIPVPVDLFTWALWLEEHNDERIVSQETVGHYWISTVFVGLDHNFSETGPPLVFETMVFDQSRRRSLGRGVTSLGEDMECERTPTWELALEAHARLVAGVRDALAHEHS